MAKVKRELAASSVGRQARRDGTIEAIALVFPAAELIQYAKAWEKITCENYNWAETILRMIDVIFSAAAGAAPDRVVANAYGTINAQHYHFQIYLLHEFPKLLFHILAHKFGVLFCVVAFLLSSRAP